MLDAITKGTEGRTSLCLRLEFTLHILNACVFLVSSPHGHGRAKKGAKKATKITKVEQLCYKHVQRPGYSPLERRSQEGL